MALEDMINVWNDVKGDNFQYRSFLLAMNEMRKSTGKKQKQQKKT